MNDWIAIGSKPTLQENGVMQYCPKCGKDFGDRSCIIQRYKKGAYRDYESEEVTAYHSFPLVHYDYLECLCPRCLYTWKEKTKDAA